MGDLAVLSTVVAPSASHTYVPTFHLYDDHRYPTPRVRTSVPSTILTPLPIQSAVIF